MSQDFFEHPILNSPYEYPRRHWELEPSGQPTGKILEFRRPAKFVTPIPKPKKRRGGAQELVFDEGLGLSSAEQQYNLTSSVSRVQRKVDEWRNLPDPTQWRVTPETARLLQHWRSGQGNPRPVFCQVEAVETAIWLTEVAPQDREGKEILELLSNASREASPDLLRVAFKLATGAGKTTVMAMLIACAFNFEAQATEFGRLGRVPVLKARMNADLHMGGELKSTGKGKLFVIFGEPSVRIEEVEGGKVRVVLEGVDVYDPNSGEIRSDNADGIACWFIDTDYNEESFFVRHAYFLGQNDPYGALKTSLRAEIDAEAWASLNSDTSRPFERPKSGRIAVKVINHLGDEVMKVFRV